MKSKGVDEFGILAIGVVVIIIVLAGAQITDVSPVKFLFMAIVAILSGGAAILLLLVVGISVVDVWVEAHKEDGRSLKEVLREEYSPRKTARNYRVLVDHITDFITDIAQSEIGKKYKGLAAFYYNRARAAWYDYFNPRIDD